MKTSLNRIASQPVVMIAKALDGDNRYEVRVSPEGSTSVFVENTTSGARSFIPTQSSVATILLLRENMSAPAFAQITWGLFRWIVEELKRQTSAFNKESA